MNPSEEKTARATVGQVSKFKSLLERKQASQLELRIRHCLSLKHVCLALTPQY
jgi:hypothetical protein